MISLSQQKESEITHDGMVFNNDAKQRFYENLRSRSIFYDLVRKIKHKHYSSDKKNFFTILIIVLKSIKNLKCLRI